ncbi:MAG: response regulator [Vicinamibacterales bacterium]
MSLSPQRRPSSLDAVLLPAGTFPVTGEIPAGPAAMQQRIRELEALCAEVYEAAVVLGLPKRLLSRLWTVAARGNQPHAFDIDLPTGTPAAPLPNISLTHRPDRAKDAWASLPPLVKRRKLMVVDDDPVMLEMVTRILSTENYELMTADSAESALQLFEAHGAPDLLVTDLMMPGLSGAELAGIMRQRCPSVRVLYQTGYTDTLFHARIELDPGASFVEKPFSACGLLEAARFALFDTLNPDATTAP